MDNEGLVITIGADVVDAIQGVQQLQFQLKSAEIDLNNISRALDQAIASGHDLTSLEDDYQAVSDKVKGLRAQIEGIQAPKLTPLAAEIETIAPATSQATAGLQSMGLSTTQARIAFIDLGRIITGQGFSLRSLASNFTLLGPAVTIGAAALYGLYELLTKQTDAEKKADLQAKELAKTLLNLKSAMQVGDEATGSEAGNIDRIQALAAAIQDTTLAYSKRKNALDELKETNKAYFGDLTLEQNSLATLTRRIEEYSNAIIAEAVVKKQTDAIAELTSKYLDQERALAKLKTIRDQAIAAEAIGKKNLPTNIAGEGEEAAAVQQLSLHDATYKATQAFLAQRDAVEQISAQIAEYHGALNAAIQDQLKYKPLKDFNSPDELKSVIPILEQIQKIQEEIAKPSKEPLFQQNQLAQQLSNPTSITSQLFEAKIQEAFANGIKKGADDPRIKEAYDKLADTLKQLEQHQQNPDLHAQFAFQYADVDDKELKQFHEDSGKQLTDYSKKLPPLKSDIKVDLPQDVFTQFEEDFQKQLDKTRQTLQKNIDSFSADIGNAFLEDLGKGIGDALSGKGLQSAFDAFMEFLGDAIIKIGEQLIVAAGLFQVINVALASLFDNPALAAVAGIAAIAAGEVIKNSFKGHAFATGGIVTGPTLGLVGEAGPEVIFPLERLNQFVKNVQSPNSQPVRVVGTIRGRDIAISNARDAKLQGMV